MQTFLPATAARRAQRHVRRFAMAGGLALLPGVAAAQSAASPIDAAALQGQLRSWFANILAPAVTLPELPLTVTRDGEVYKLTLPASYWGGPDGNDVTVDLRRIDGGAWSVDGLKAPATGTFSTASVTDKSLIPTVEARYQVGAQSLKAVIDPELRQRSSVLLEARDLVLDMRVDTEKQAQRIDRYTLEGTLVPAADGRFSVTQDATMAGWIATADSSLGLGTEMGARNARITMRLDGVRSDRIGAAFTTLKELVAVVLADPPDGNDGDKGPDGKSLDGKAPATKDPVAKPAMPGPDLLLIGRQKARALLEAFRDMADRMEADEVIDDFTMTLPMVGRVTLGKMHYGLGAEVPDGRLRAWTELSLAGLQADAIPPNFVDYVPTRVSLRPVISGVQTERIFNLLLRSLDENPDFAALEAEAIALLASTDTVIGLESLAIDLAPVRLTGSGRVRVVNKDKASIEGRLTATGFDALITEANKKPELKTAAPFLVMARGLGRQEGDKLVWDLAISDSQALVNGVDVMALQPPAEQKPAPAQRPNRR